MTASWLWWLFINDVSLVVVGGIWGAWLAGRENGRAQ